MYRTAYDKLIKWKDKQNRKPLLVTGVRQCGKTYLIKEFGNSMFKDMAYINFDGNEALKALFTYDFDTKRIIDELESIVLGKKIIPGETLLFFDEIQACPRAIQSLKYFCEDEPGLHIIAAGSLLGVLIGESGTSFPVGKVDRLEMFPMSFEEFVIADGGQKYIEGLKKLPKDREISALYTEPMKKYLRNYYVAGGMPEVVQAWINNHNYDEIDELQGNILKDYADDFSKHTNPETATKLKMIWDSVPVQIAKDNNKFVFSHVKEGLRSKELEDALQWIVNSGLVYKLNLVSNPEIPLSGMADTTFFKIYMSDVGLLRKKSNINYSTLIEKNDLFISFKGALTENYVLTQLKCLGIESFFWKSNSDAEVDFIIDFGGKVTPVEVKSADNTKAKSLHTFCNRYEPENAVKSSLKNIGNNQNSKTTVWSVPLYMIFRLKDYL